jgi:hypothetical protein
VNMTDVGKPMCYLHPSEVQRLLSWLRCNPVVGRETARKSLEALLRQSLELSEHSAIPVCPNCGNHDKSLLLGNCTTSVNGWHRSLAHTCGASSTFVPDSDGPCMACAQEKGLATGIDDGPPNSICLCGKGIKCPIHQASGKPTEDLRATLRLLAERLIRYFPKGPISPLLDADIEIRQMARDAIKKCDAL